MFADGKVADVQRRLARFQDLAVVELDFVIRHLAGVVHAGVPRQNRLVLAVHDRNGKTGHLLRRRGVLDRNGGFPGFARIAGGVESGHFRIVLADCEVFEPRRGATYDLDLICTAHFVILDSNVIGPAP